MSKLKKTVRIETPEFTASDWQLYQDYKKVGYVKERDPRGKEGAMRLVAEYAVDPSGEKSKESAKAAETLNHAFATYVNDGADLPEVYRAMYNIMGKVGCGATDTEPRGFLLGLLDEVYGRDRVMEEYG